MRLVFEMLTCGGFNGLRVDCGSGFVSVSVGAASVLGSWLPAVSDTIARRVAVFSLVAASPMMSLMVLNVAGSELRFRCRESGCLELLTRDVPMLDVGLDVSLMKSEE